MSSKFKKAHKTHALAQRAGEGYARASGGDGRPLSGSSDQLSKLFAEFCELVTSGPERAELLGVSSELEAAWSRSERLPVLRAHQKRLERAVRAARSAPPQ